VEAAGLKTVFGMFMKKQDGQTTEHLLGIFSSLLRLLPANSSGRIRTLAKFVEKEYEKLDKLVKLRRDYASRLAVVDEQIRTEQSKLDAEEKEEMADEWLSRRLDAGLFCLQTIDIILAWLVAEDDGASKKIQSLLADRDETLAALKTTIQEQLDDLAGESEEETMMKDMLGTLLQFLM
jgi:beta-catenin-like protein 1